MRPLRILLANSHPIVRSNLRLLIEREPGLHVVAEAATGEEAMALADYRHPDIVLLNINLSQVNGIVTAREILAKNKQVIIIFVTPHPDEAYVAEALKTGARGYVMEDCAETDLMAAIQTTGAGGEFISPRVRTPATDQLVRGSGQPEQVRSADAVPELLRMPQ